jgi:hypothetical protein
MSRAASTVVQAEPPRPLTYEQLHEQQCIACSATTDLRPAGHRTVNGLAWAVVACPKHEGEAS